MGIIENELTNEIQAPKKLPLRNNRLQYNNVDDIIETNNVENSHTTKILNTSSPVQNPPETILQNNDMSIPEYSFQSIISSSSNNSDTLIPTKHGTYNFKTKKILIPIPIQKFHTPKNIWNKSKTPT